MSDLLRAPDSLLPTDADVRRRVAWYTAPPMFFLSLTFLVCQAILVVFWVDMPNLNESALASLNPIQRGDSRIRQLLAQHGGDHRLQRAAVGLIICIWPIVIVESIWHWASRPWDRAIRKYHFFTLLFCLCPSLRMCARCPEMHERIWLPMLKWRQPNRRLRRRLQRRFSLPMIGISLLIMPVLIVEFFMQAQVAQYVWLRMFLHIGTGVIWFAFALEFILMVSIAKKKLKYCKQHWVDIAIIALPLLSMLRSLQLVRSTSLLRLPMLTKLARVYRLRGTAVKVFNGLLVLEFFHRALGGDPERRIARLQEQLADVELQAKELRRKIVKLERDCAAADDEDSSGSPV